MLTYHVDNQMLVQRHVRLIDSTVDFGGIRDPVIVDFPDFFFENCPANQLRLESLFGRQPASGLQGLVRVTVYRHSGAF
jgi:hypothetical protein